MLIGDKKAKIDETRLLQQKLEVDLMFVEGCELDWVVDRVSYEPRFILVENLAILRNRPFGEHLILARGFS